MHPFPVGTRVETNEEYFKQFGRKVIGTSVAMNPMPPNVVTIVRWDFQEGKTIPSQTGHNVLMLSKDLQIYRTH